MSHPHQANENTARPTPVEKKSIKAITPGFALANCRRFQATLAGLTSNETNWPKMRHARRWGLHQSRIFGPLLRASGPVLPPPNGQPSTENLGQTQRFYRISRQRFVGAMVKICVQIVGCHGGGASKQPPGHSPGSPNCRPTALPQSLLEVAAGVPSHRQQNLAGVVIANWSHEWVPCWTFVGQQCCHDMSLDDTHYLNPGGKTSFRAVFSHSWIDFLNRASQV